jgi:large subunit ribosomal protein L25
MSIKLIAKSRTDLGKGASRRLRHADLVPAIVYGAGKEPVSVTFEQKDLRKVEAVEAFYSSVLNLEIDGTSEQVVLKALQRHAFKERIQHLDLLRIDATQKLVTAVPLHFLNEDTAEAVKNGGVVSRIANEVELSCFAVDLPAFIEVDLSKMAIGDTIHISDLKLPANVESVELTKGEAHDLPLVSITQQVTQVEEEEAPAPAAAEETSAE